MRQEIRGLVQQVDAQFVVGDADMDVQTTDREPPADPLQIVLQIGVAAALGGLLRVPAGERVGRGGDRGHAVPRRDLGDRAAQPAEVGARLGKAPAHPRPHLDLRAQKLRPDLPGEQPLALGQHRRRRVVHDIAGRPIDEEILLLDPKGEFRLGQGHRQPRAHARQPGRQS